VSVTVANIKKFIAVLASRKLFLGDC